MYVVMWNGRVGYNAKNEISGAYFRVISHIYWTLVTIELTNKKQLSEEVIQGKFYSIGFEQPGTLVYEITQDCTCILLSFLISVWTILLGRAWFCVAFDFFKFLCPRALIVLYRYVVSVLNLNVWSFETNCECMKSAYEQFWERPTLFSCWWVQLFLYIHKPF